MIDEQQVIADTRAWVEQAVIGLNLCPFAKAVQVKSQIAYRVSQASTPEELVADLVQELRQLATTPAEEVDTLLLIHPLVLNDFYDYNEFLDVVDAVVESEALEGVLQVASFHPHYQFADTPYQDRANYTNRSPFPMLHLLREDSISRAVDSLADPSSVYRRNMKLLRDMVDEEFERIWPKKQGD